MNFLRKWPIAFQWQVRRASLFDKREDLNTLVSGFVPGSRMVQGALGALWDRFQPIPVPTSVRGVELWQENPPGGVAFTAYLNKYCRKGEYDNSVLRK